MILPFLLGIGIMMGKKRMAGDAMRTAFGGGAITGEMQIAECEASFSNRRNAIGNPMDSPMAADQVKMPQDLQAGYLEQIDLVHRYQYMV